MENDQTHVKSLNYKLGSLKSQLTLFVKFIDSIKLNENQSNDDIINIKERIIKIEPLISAFEEIQTEIEMLTSSSEADNLNSREEFQNKYFSALSIAKSLIPVYDSDDNVSNHSNSSSKSNSIQNSISHSPQCGSHNLSIVRLPRINLPTFKGEFTNWVEFYDTFNALVHSNTEISDAQKLCYLRASLQGEPTNMIRSFKTSNDNYPIAWNMLKNRYDNKRRIIQTHVQSLLNLQQIVRENHTSLRIFMESAQNHIDCLKTLDVAVNEWDALIIPILTNKLDHLTIKEWESKINNENTTNELPTFTNFISFLRQKQATLETISSKRNFIPKCKEESKEKSLSFVTSNNFCVNCKQSHYIIQNCKEFLNLNISDRIKRIKELHLCINCLRKGHFIQDCKATTCKNCNKKHNTLLHLATNQIVEIKPTVNINETNESNTNSFMAYIVNSQILLSTAKVNVLSSNRKSISVRTLLDSASQLNFITDTLCNMLNLKKEKVNMSVTGINQGNQSIKYKTDITIYSQTNKFNAILTCLIVPTISKNIPQISFDNSNLNIPENIVLADKEFNKAAPIDILIGSSIFWTLLSVGQIKTSPNGPVLQKTKLGWIVAGNINITDQLSEAVTYKSLETIHNDLKQFWKIDEFTSNSKCKTKDELFCEEHFERSTQRHSDGKFIVRIPFKPDLISLGSSKVPAEKRFRSLEKRFDHEPTTKIRYIQFMQEYLDLGHMSKIKSDSNSETFFLPHHPVIKESSETTKLRVVFDGSCKLDSGKSLNEVQHVGPTVQEELFSIILRFRTHTYVLTGDIEKMYRQIWMHPSDRRYQQILWRPDISEAIGTYQLNTVTYGTASAPYLATRCLYQLSKDFEITNPIESQAIRNDFYVDDIITGSNEINSLKSLKENLTYILSTAGFPLRKWNSNLQELNESNHNANLIPLGKDLHKLLGIFWNSSEDYFTFSINHLKEFNHVSKRTILSCTAQLFDPLGLLAPTIIYAKLIIQKLWHEKLSWDESIPGDLFSHWTKFKTQLRDLSKLKIPRLELCAAVLLAQLMKKFSNILNININAHHFWSDSKIVLSWINSSPTRWKTYVANRVAEIQSLSNPEHWHHVSSQHNAADPITRGVMPSDLAKLKLVWLGPNWLTLPEHLWPNTILETNKFDESETQKCFHIVFKSKHFKTNGCLLPTIYKKLPIEQQERNLEFLSVDEVHKAFVTLIKISQEESFHFELINLKNGKPLNPKSKLISLCPFIDTDHILRVGGRLGHSNFTFDKKHPILLNNKHHLTKLIFDNIHKSLMHCGPKLLLSSIRDKFWAISGRNIARQTVRNCIVCFKHNPKSQFPIMGNLPLNRITSMPPFHTTGIDYAGPMILKDRKGRGCKTYKAYISLFICFSTKAIHLELVSEFTTDGFLAAFRRFVSRRGKPLNIYSDNGTNFKGANNELNRLYEFLSQNKEFIKQENLSDGINWHFIPVNSPHFGGLWEAGVKSVKYHLKRTIQNSLLTYEDMNTILVQIEAILNSRPLTPLSSDPNDTEALTPAHFLIGRPFTTLPDPNVLDVTENRLSRFQHLQKIQQHFWQRWHKEYINELQQRTKWKTNNTNINIGSLVIIKDDNQPPSNWRLGRISSLHPGKDNISRVATLKTKCGDITRCITKLCALPIEEL